MLALLRAPGWPQGQSLLGLNVTWSQRLSLVWKVESWSRCTWDQPQCLPCFMYDQHCMGDLFAEQFPPWRTSRSHATLRRWPAAEALSRVGAWGHALNVLMIYVIHLAVTVQPVLRSTAGRRCQLWESVSALQVSTGDSRSEAAHTCFLFRTDAG